jgi:hypothetical protein
VVYIAEMVTGALLFYGGSLNNTVEKSPKIKIIGRNENNSFFLLIPVP